MSDDKKRPDLERNASEGVPRRSFLQYVAAAFSMATLPDVLQGCAAETASHTELVGTALDASTLSPMINVVRPQDMLSLGIQLSNLTVDANRNLTRPFRGSSFIALTFPPQHVEEDAFDPPAPSNTSTFATPYARSAIAGPSVVVFKIADLFSPRPYTLASILELCAAGTLIVAPNAASSQLVPAPIQSPAQGAASYTYIEAPTRLLLSPNERAAFAHASSPVVSSTGRTELWHTRLGVRSRPGSAAVDEGTPSDRSMRALWTRDYEVANISKPNDATKIATPTKQPLDGQAPPAGTPTVTTELPADKRNRAVIDTQPGRHVFEVERLLMTPYGATFDFHGAFPEDASLKSWTQKMSLGRDELVDVVSTGYLLPFGIPVVCDFIRTRCDDPAAGAVGTLYSWCVLRITNPNISLRDPADPAFRKVRRFPFVSIAAQTRTLRCNADVVKGGWVISTDADRARIALPFVGTCWKGRQHPFSTPLYYLPNDPKGPVSAFAAAGTWNKEKVTVAFDNRRIAYAPSKKDDTSFETKSFMLKLTSPTVPAPAPALLPSAETLELAVEAIRHATPGQASDSTFDYHELYADNAASDPFDAGTNPRELLFRFADESANKLSVKFSKKKDDATGGPAQPPGLVTPDFSVAAISRRHGPVGNGNPNDASAFTPSVYFPKQMAPAASFPSGAAPSIDSLLPKLFGFLDLADILKEVTGLDAAKCMPKMVTQELHEVETFLAEMEALLSGFDDAVAFVSQCQAASQGNVLRAQKALTDLAAIVPPTADSLSKTAAQKSALSAANLAYASLQSVVDAFDNLTAAASNVGRDLAPPGGTPDWDALFDHDLSPLLGALQTLLDGLDEPSVPARVRAMLDGTIRGLRTQWKTIQSIVSDVGAFRSLVQQAEQGLEMAKNMTVKVEWRPKLSTFDAGGIACFVPLAGEDGQRGLLLSLELRAKAIGDQPPGADLLCRLDQFAIGFGKGNLEGSFVSLHFDSIQFTAAAGKKPDVDVKLGGIDFGGPLSFVETLKDLIPLDGFSDPPYLDVTSDGISAGFNLALPNISVGMFSIDNMKIAAGLRLPFIGDDPLTFRFAFCEKDDPFVVTVAMLGGGGYFAIELTPKGIQKIEASIEVCAQLAIDLGVAAGCVSIAAGFYFSYTPGDGILLQGYLRFRGQVCVLGLIAVSIELRMDLTYTSHDGKVVGHATIKIEIDLAFFHKTVEASAERKFAGANGDPTFAQLMAPNPFSMSPLADYCMAFAAA